MSKIPPGVTATAFEQSLSKMHADFREKVGVSSGDAIPSAGLSAFRSPFGEMTDFYAKPFIGWQACAMVATHWVGQRAINVVGEILTSQAPILQHNGLATDIPDIVREIAPYVMSDIRKCAAITRTYGQAIVTVGGDIIEPMWCSPLFARTAANTMSYPNAWRVPGNKKMREGVDAFTAREGYVPAWLRPMFYWGGIPVTQRIYEALYKASVMSDEVLALVRSKRTVVYDSDNADYATDPDRATAEAEQIAAARDNFGVVLKSQEKQVKQFLTDLQGLEGVYDRLWSIVASAAGVSEALLFGTPTRQASEGQSAYIRATAERSLLSQWNNYALPVLQAWRMRVFKSKGIKLDVNFIQPPRDIFGTAKELAEASRYHSAAELLHEQAQAVPGEGQINDTSKEAEESRENQEEIRQGINNAT